MLTDNGCQDQRLLLTATPLRAVWLESFPALLGRLDTLESNSLGMDFYTIGVNDGGVAGEFLVQRVINEKQVGGYADQDTKREPFVDRINCHVHT